MTTHAVCYETLGSRNANFSGGRPDNAWHQKVSSLPWQTDNVLTDPVPYELIPKSATGAQASFTVAHALIRPRVDGGVNSMGMLLPDADFGQLDGATLDNGAVNAINIASSAYGRQSPAIGLAFDGDFETALGALGTAESIDVTLLHHYGTATYQGLAHFIAFEEQPPNTDEDGGTALKALLNSIQNGGSSVQVGTNSANEPIVVNACGFAANAPEGAVYIDPSDIGTGPDQLNSDITLNTGAKFAAHPSVFYPSGRADFVRSVTRQNVDSIALNTGSTQPMRIVQVTQAPTSSNWLFIVDGVPQVVNVAHPQGSDIRRPRDIWNQIIVPIFSSASTSVNDALTWLSPTSSDGGGIGTRWKYLDYARCLELEGSNLIQTGGGG